MTGLINITGVFVGVSNIAQHLHAKQFAVGIHYFCLEKT